MDLSEFEKEYKSWVKCFCPYLDGEVFFVSNGFSHLIWKKGRVKREESVIRQRMESLKYVRVILQKSGTLQEYEDTGHQEYFCFIAIVANTKYKVVVMKTKSGRYNFVSIIPRWVTGSRDKDLHKSKLENPSLSG
jgi:hypothetical protein